MNHFQEALASGRTTVLYGVYGRHPRLARFYLEALPELSPASDSEPLYWYRDRRLLSVLLEPPFDAAVPPDRWCLVLTSHLRLRFDPLSTRVVDTHLRHRGRQLPPPSDLSPDHARLVPPAGHLLPFFCSFDPGPYRVDLSGVADTHEAYLRLLTFFDVLRPSTVWSLAVPEALRRRLARDVPGTGPYDAHLLRALLG